MLRDYLGNREQMIAALNMHVAESFNALTSELDVALASIETSTELIEILFAVDNAIDPRRMLAWHALTASAGDHPHLSRQLLNSLSQFLNVLERAFRRISPVADEAQVRAVAPGGSAAFQGLDAVSPLNPPSNWQHGLKLSAMLLARTLEPVT